MCILCIVSCSTNYKVYTKIELGSQYMCDATGLRLWENEIYNMFGRKDKILEDMEVVKKIFIVITCFSGK